ncbi:hypothetical protein GN156_14325 [bacterium LRH843]|nr:hypothetical protein [bacterium LRH843]
MMNNKLTDKLHSFPKNHELSREAKFKIEAALQEEIKKMEKQKKSIELKGLFNKSPLYVASITVIALVTLLFVSSESLNLFQTPIQSDESTSAVGEQELVEEYEEIAELSTIWANALKIRDGKPRFEMMSDKAKEKFIQEQIIRGGENWNYNIGESSPWVVDFEIETDGMKAVITYETQTSEPAYYHTRETLSYVKENGKYVVDDFETNFENKLIEENGQLIDGDQQVTEHMHQVISDYIIAEHQKSDYQKTDIQFEVHKVYGTMQENDIITVYLWSFYNSFNKATGSEVVAGASIPTTVIKLKSMAEGYEVVDYIVPKDGSESYSSLKSMFPEKYVEIAIQNTGYIEVLKSEMNLKIEEWLER